MTEISNSDSHEFDVAVSFAGENREIVEEVVALLKGAGIRVFYDSDYIAEMWGQDLAEYFDEVFRIKARYAILFISHSYAEKMWTTHERRSALARALEQPSNPYVLPVRLDDTSLQGLRPTVGYLDARKIGVGGIAQAVQAKLTGTSFSKSTTIDHVPRTELERQQVLLERPPAWEYLYFAAQLLHERNLIENKYRDYEIRYANLTGDWVGRQGITDYIKRWADDARRIIATFGFLMDADAQERAFGAPGQPGDPERIAHLAKRWNTIYESCIDWTAKIRGISTPSELHRLVESLARFMDNPIREYREFVDAFVKQVDQIPAILASGESVSFDMTLRLTISDEATAIFSEEIDRLTTQ